METIVSNIKGSFLDRKVVLLDLPELSHIIRRDISAERLQDSNPGAESIHAIALNHSLIPSFQSSFDANVFILG